MLCSIKLSPEATPKELASEILGQWDGYKVFHITGRKFSEASDMRAFYDQMMELCGKPAEIGESVVAAADRNSREQLSGERWTEIRYDPKIPDAYRHSANAQPMHTDGSYVPDFPEAATIYCQQSAANGGETTFLNSDDLISCLQEEDPALLERLTSENILHSRSGVEKLAPIIDTASDKTILSWNYYCVAESETPEHADLKEQFFKYLNDSTLIKSKTVPVALRPGDCVIWKDHELLHGRNGFNPSMPSERFLWKSAFQVE